MVTSINSVLPLPEVVTGSDVEPQTRHILPGETILLFTNKPSQYRTHRLMLKGKIMMYDSTQAVNRKIFRDGICVVMVCEDIGSLDEVVAHLQNLCDRTNEKRNSALEHYVSLVTGVSFENMEDKLLKVGLQCKSEAKPEAADKAASKEEAKSFKPGRMTRISQEFEAERAFGPVNRFHFVQRYALNHRHEMFQ